MAPPWSSALTEYARTANPASLPADVLVAYDEHTLTIQDAYPKAQYHYLVLPRMPWRLTGEEWGEVQKDMAEGKEGEAGGGSKEPEQVAQQKQGKQQQQLNFAGGAMGLARPAPKETATQASSSSHQDGASSSASTNSTAAHIIPPTHLLNLSTLLTSPYRSIILRHLSRAAHAAEQRIRSLMPQTRISTAGQARGQQETAGCTWDVQVGFHAVPSMDTVHCHVLSGELLSERLKNKKVRLRRSSRQYLALSRCSWLTQLLTLAFVHAALPLLLTPHWILPPSLHLPTPFHSDSTKQASPPCITLRSPPERPTGVACRREDVPQHSGAEAPLE